MTWVSWVLYVVPLSVALTLALLVLGGIALHLVRTHWFAAVAPRPQPERAPIVRARGASLVPAASPRQAASA